MTIKKLTTDERLKIADISYQIEILYTARKEINNQLEKLKNKKHKIESGVK